MRIMRITAFWSYVVLVAASCGIIAGCKVDPEKAKNRYLAKGNEYFEQGQYPQAVIEFENAVQVDPKFAEAHYRLAQSFLKETDWSHGYQELSKTIELQPTNWQAQLDIADLYLASGKFADARDRATAVLKSDPGNAQAQ